MSDAPSDDPANELRAVSAEADAWGEEPHLTLVLVGMPNLPENGIRVSVEDYPPLSMQLNAPRSTPEDRPDPLAYLHPERKWLPHNLDLALGLILRPRGGAALSATVWLLPEGGAARLVIRVRPGRAAPMMGLQRWFHSLRIINAWRTHAWVFGSSGIRMHPKAIDAYEIEAEVDEVATQDSGYQIAAANQILARYAVEALNFILHPAPAPPHKR
ncbi:MAG TPA: hypothetical protein VLA88_03005 [Candidatus Saccharimonadales bacterium]|nr:hypothetical protein [Candidatus Saccharimonadales bacterium]